MSAWLLALRLARREVRRAKGRSALVVALIGLPVALLGFLAVTVDSFDLTPEQRLDRELGAAEARLSWLDRGPIEQFHEGFGSVPPDREPRPLAEPATAEDYAEVLPSGSRVVPKREDDRRMTTAGGVGTISVEGADLDDPVHQGRLVLRDGQAPDGPGEAALTASASERLAAGIGDTITTADGDAAWDVVGIVEYPGMFREQIVLHPDAVDTEPSGWFLLSPDPVTWDQVKELNTHGIEVRSQAVSIDPPPMSERYEQYRFGSGSSTTTETLSLAAVVVGLAVLEVVLLAGPAFAVGARRRQRELAVTAISGAAPAQLRRIVLADGVVLGALAAAVGLLVGAVTAAGALPLLEEYAFGRRSGGFSLWPSVLAGLAGLAVLTGVLAALVPAATVARQDVVQALAGRRGATGSRRRWLVVGLILAGSGAVLAAAGAWQVAPEMLAAGAILAQLGLVLCTPRIIGLVARVGRWLPLAPRVALRDTARNRAAAAPAVSAVTAAVAGAVAIGMVALSDEARNENMYHASMPEGYVYSMELYGDVLSAAEQAQIREALDAMPQATAVIELTRPACPPDEEDSEGSEDRAAAEARATGRSHPAYRCDVSVTRPDENECPVEYRGEPLSDAERDRMRADHRCRSGGGIFSGGPTSAVTDGAQLAALTGASTQEAERARQVLAAGGVVVADPLLVHDGETTISARGPDQQDPGDEPIERSVPAVALTTAEVDSSQLRLLSPELVSDLGLGTVPGGAVAATDAAPPQEEIDRVSDRLGAIHGQLRASVERGPPSVGPMMLVLAGVAGVIALGAAAIATGLAAADRRPDLATLAAVGASPRVRRSLSLSQSGVIAGLGALLGAAAGLGTGAAVVAMSNQNLWHRAGGSLPEPYPLMMPWQELALLAVVPLVAMLGAGLFTRSRLPVERRTT